MFRARLLLTALLAVAPRGERVEVGDATQIAAPATRVPFGVGERLEYDVKYGAVHVGNASMELVSIDTVRGRGAYHAIFTVNGGLPFLCRVNDRLESWIDVNALSALRFRQDIHECGYDRQRLYQFLPESHSVIEGSDTSLTVDHPLDEASFLYFIRTIALPIGLDTGFNNYFIPDRNPIRIRVVGREHIKVPAGEFDAIIIQPTIKAKGMFSEGGQAQIWLSDDSRHIMLQMKTKVPGIASLHLYLKVYRPPNPT